MKPSKIFIPSRSSEQSRQLSPQIINEHSKKFTSPSHFRSPVKLTQSGHGLHAKSTKNFESITLDDVEDTQAKK